MVSHEDLELMFLLKRLIRYRIKQLQKEIVEIIIILVFGALVLVSMVLDIINNFSYYKELEGVSAYVFIAYLGAVISFAILYGALLVRERADIARLKEEIGKLEEYQERIKEKVMGDG